MVILVAGATGSLGTRITMGLLRSGAKVRALVRPTSQLDVIGPSGAEVVDGDLKDPGSLERACRSVDVVITTASASKRGGDSIDDVDLKGNRHLIDAASRAGVRHLILTSTLGASESSPVPLFQAKAAAEMHLRASGMTWTVLQPNAFMDVWFGMLIEAAIFTGQPVTLVGESRRRHSFVAERDVAAFAIAAVEHPAARNSTLVIGGPEAVTLTEVVRAYEEAAGQAIPVRRVPPGAPIPGVPEPVWGLVANLEQYDSEVPMDATARTFGVALTPVSAFARARMAASPI